MTMHAPAGAICRRRRDVLSRDRRDSTEPWITTPQLMVVEAGFGTGPTPLNWGQLSLPWERLADGATTAQILDEMRQARDEVTCALSYAVTHAAEYGADPTRLVLFGHSGGANSAGYAVWTEPAAFAGCEVEPADWTVHGLMLWDGDWLALNPPWDVFETDMAAILPLVSPWPSLASATEVPQVDAELAVTATARGWIRASIASPDAEQLAWRDPTRRMENELQAIDAFADGYLDIGEASEVMVNALRARGVNASLLELTDPASDHNTLAEADFDLMVEHVLALAGT